MGADRFNLDLQPLCTVGWEQVLWSTDQSVIVDLENGLWSELSSSEFSSLHTLVQRRLRDLVFSYYWSGWQNPTDQVFKTQAFFCSLSHLSSPLSLDLAPQFFWGQQLLGAASCTTSRPTELLPTAAAQGPTSTPAQLAPAAVIQSLLANSTIRGTWRKLERAANLARHNRSNQFLLMFHRILPS